MQLPTHVPLSVHRVMHRSTTHALLPVVRDSVFASSRLLSSPRLLAFKTKLFNYHTIPSYDRLGQVSTHIEICMHGDLVWPSAAPAALARLGSNHRSTVLQLYALASHTYYLSIYLYALLISSWCAMGPCRALVHRRMGGAGTHTVTGSLLGSHRCQAVPVHVDSCAGTCDVGLPATRRTTQLDQGVVPRCRYTPYDLGTA